MSEKLLGQLVELAGGTYWQAEHDHNIPWKSIVTIKGITQAQADLIADILLAVVAAPFSLEVRVHIAAPIVNISGSHTL